jgi:hypothetical protein
MKPPRVFISYSHDSDAHKAWVAKLASDLRTRGVDVILDQWDLPLGGDMAAFMEKSIADSDRVLLICTESYAAKANGGKGGVGYERLVVSGEVVAQISTTKFVPLVRGGGSELVPRFLGPRRYLDFSADAAYDARIDELGKELHGIPSAIKPTLGPNPYSATLGASAESSRRAGPSGLLTSGERLLADAWFEERSTEAARGLSTIGLNGAMELRSALHEPIRKSQMELLAAVKGSEVRTFGWPIGVTLENREEHRARPFNDGVRAEVAITERLIGGAPSYDYWAARVNGDFYTLQSFFEDMRAEAKLFFNTRIVRVTEGLMFASNFYQLLGVPLANQVSVGFSHLGLAGRTISSSNPNRNVWPRKAAESRSEGELVDSIAGLRSNIVDHVIKICEPMFMLFEFATFERSIYDQIVTDYVNGRAT